MTSTTTSQIVWPGPAVAGCVFCTIIRDTRGVALDHSQRFNFFPAAPVCSVAWVLAGDCHLVERPEQMERPWTGAKLPDLSVFGPQLGPLISWNPGETYAIKISFYPDAFAAMTGLDLSQFAGRMASAEQVLQNRFCHRRSCSLAANSAMTSDAKGSKGAARFWKTRSRSSGPALVPPGRGR